MHFAAPLGSAAGSGHTPSPATALQLCFWLLAHLSVYTHNVDDTLQSYSPAFAVSQAVPRILCTPNVHYHDHNSTPLVPIIIRSIQSILSRPISV